MDITEEQMNQIEAALAKLADMDPADLPDPAAELARLLGQILELSEES